MVDKMILPENHYFFNISKDIREVCEPLFKYKEINHFCYCRYFNDGTHALLITNENLYKHHLS